MRMCLRWEHQKQETAKVSIAFVLMIVVAVMSVLQQWNKPTQLHTLQSCYFITENCDDNI